MALFVRLGYALVAPAIDPFLRQDPLLGDAASYDRIARMLLAGGPYGEGAPSLFWPPLFPMMLAVIYGLFGYDLVIARLVQAVLGAILPPLVYLAATHQTSARVARLVGLGTAFYPFLIYFGTWLIAESLFFALFAWMLWVAVRLQRRPTAGRAIVLGLVIGLAALTKPTVLFQLPFLACWFLLALTRVGWLRRLALGAITAVALVIALAPWTLHNTLVHGAPVLIALNGGYTFYGANNADAFGGHYERFPPRLAGLSEIEEQSAYYQLGLTWIREHPADFAILVGKKLVRLLSPLSVASSPDDYALPGALYVRIIYGAFLATAAVGMVRTLRRWRAYLLWYVPVLGVLASTIVFYGDTRYLLPAVPSLVLFAALAIDLLLGQRRVPLHSAVGRSQ